MTRGRRSKENNHTEVSTDGIRDVQPRGEVAMTTLTSTTPMPEWLAPLARTARVQTIDYPPGSPAAAVSALATYRETVQLALRHLFAGLGETAVRNALAEGMLLAEGYIGRLDDAAEGIAAAYAAFPRARLVHYVVKGTFQQGRVYLNRCLCGRTYYRMGLPDEYQAERHVHVMSLPNILSGECDCGGDRSVIPAFEGRCTGCGAVLHGSALTNRKEVGG